MKSFFTRLISGIVLLAIIISTGIVGGAGAVWIHTADFPDWILGVSAGLWIWRKKRPGIWGMIFVVLYYGTVLHGRGSESGGSAVCW